MVGLEQFDETEKPEHNHPADFERLKAYTSYGKMKEQAKVSDAKPAQIFSQGTLPLKSSTRARLPLEDSAKRTFRNHKRGNMPQMPARLEDLVIEGKLRCHLNEPRTARYDII